MAGKEGYWLMDGRANYDVNAAYVLRSCENLSEAKEHINDYGADTCIVDVETQTVVDSLMWRSPTKRAGDGRKAGAKSKVSKGDGGSKAARA